MKLEHLLQAYKINNIDTEVKNMSDKKKAGVITFADGISASYLLDNEDIVIAMEIFFNCLARNNKPQAQINHVIKVLNVIQQTIMLLGNITQKETNMILEKLGLFDNTFRDEKQIKHLEHAYKIEVIDGLLCLSIDEIRHEE